MSDTGMPSVEPPVVEPEAAAVEVSSSYPIWGLESDKDVLAAVNAGTLLTDDGELQVVVRALCRMMKV